MQARHIVDNIDIGKFESLVSNFGDEDREFSNGDVMGMVGSAWWWWWWWWGYVSV